MYPPARIVCLTEETTETLYLLGEQHRIVGISGYTVREMVAYLLLVHISRMFSSMPGLSGGIAQDIRDGTLKKYLLQPLDMIGYLVSYRAAHKVAYIATSALPYCILFFLCASYFDGFPDLATLAIYARRQKGRHFVF